MRVILDTKFNPRIDVGTGVVTVYYAIVEVEVGGETFSAKWEMPPEEYERTFPLMRDYFHEMLKKDIMKQIEKRIFIEGAKA